MSDNLSAVEQETGAVLDHAATAPSLGEILRTARLEKTSSSIEEIASEIRIRPHLLQALENDDYDAFPGFVYAMGFLRAYANYLGLNAVELTERLRKSQFAAQKDSTLVFPQPIEDSRMPKRWLAVAASILCLGVYGVWYGISAVGDGALDRVPEVAKTLAQDAVAATPVPVVAQPAEPSPAAKAQALLEPQPQTQQLPLPATPAEMPAEPAPAEKAEVLKSISNDAADEAAPVTLRAKSDAWVRIEGPDSKPILDRVLRAGEAYSAPAQPGLVLITGNAGALDVSVGGHNLGTLGPEGAIRRNIALNAEALREYAVVNQ